MPDSIRALTSIAEPDYADFCSASTEDAMTRPPERWIRGVLEETPRRVSLALFLRYDRPIAALIWAPVSVVHRRALPKLLEQGVMVED
jgi:hypothetical protein